MKKNISHKYIYVYQTINKVNRKSYIGVHSTNEINDGYIGCGIRKQSDAHRNTFFHKAVRKYGYNNFQCFILSFFETYEAAVEEERFLVDKKWVKSSNNYNCAIGGYGNPVYFMDYDEIRKMYSEISKKRIGIPRPDYVRDKISKANTGKKRSDVHKKNMSDGNARYWLGKKMPDSARKKMSEGCTGRKWSEKDKENLSLSHKGQIPWNRKPILKLSLSGDVVGAYESVLSAAKSVNKLSSSVCMNLRGKNKTCGGYIFKYK